MSKFLYAFLFLVTSLVVSSAHAMDDVEWSLNEAGFATPRTDGWAGDESPAPESHRKIKKDGVVKHFPIDPTSLEASQYEDTRVILLRACYELHSAELVFNHFNVVNPINRAHACGLITVPIEEGKELTISIKFPGSQEGDTETIATALASILWQRMRLPRQNDYISSLEKVVVRARRDILEALSKKDDIQTNSLWGLGNITPDESMFFLK